MGRSLLKFTAMLRALDLSRMRRDEEMNPWMARAVIKQSLAELQIPEATRRTAASVVFRQAIPLVDEVTPIVLACRRVLIAYTKFGSDLCVTFTLVASMETRGMRFRYVDETLAVLAGIRKASGFTPQVLVPSRTDSDELARMNNIICQLSEQLANLSDLGPSELLQAIEGLYLQDDPFTYQGSAHGAST